MSDTLSKSSLKTSVCEEIWQRYCIFLEERNHRNELNYCCETSKYNSTSFASSKHIISLQQEGLSRYFQCFYDSFSHLEEKKANELLDCVEKVEADLRCAITQMEKECVAVICRSMAPFLYKCMPSLLLINLLHPADAEHVSRSVIYFDYYQMLLEAATVQEIISRRNIIFSVEPQSRQKIENIEPYEWIAARQRQVNREEAVRTGQNTQDFKKTLDYLRWCEQRQKQLFFFEQSEVEERMDVERLERLHAGLIFELFLSNFREIRYNQCTYSKWKCELNQEDVKHLSKEEFSARSAIMYYQFESFKLIGGMEVRHFLKTRRNTLVNERVEIPVR